MSNVYIMYDQIQKLRLDSKHYNYIILYVSCRNQTLDLTVACTIQLQLNRRWAIDALLYDCIKPQAFTLVVLGVTLTPFFNHDKELRIFQAKMGPEMTTLVSLSD